MKKLTVILFVLCIALPAFADELRYNPYEDKYEYADKKDVLKYNGYEDRYEYASPPETPKETQSYQPPPTETKKQVRYSTEIPCIGCKPGEPRAFQYIRQQPVYTDTDEE